MQRTINQLVTQFAIIIRDEIPKISEVNTNIEPSPSWSHQLRRDRWRLCTCNWRIPWCRSVLRHSCQQAGCLPVSDRSQDPFSTSRKASVHPPRHMWYSTIRPTSRRPPAEEESKSSVKRDVLREKCISHNWQNKLFRCNANLIQYFSTLFQFSTLSFN